MLARRGAPGVALSDHLVARALGDRAGVDAGARAGSSREARRPALASSRARLRRQRRPGRSRRRARARACAGTRAGRSGSDARSTRSRSCPLPARRRAPARRARAPRRSGRRAPAPARCPRGRRRAAPSRCRSSRRSRRRAVLEHVHPPRVVGAHARPCDWAPRRQIWPMPWRFERRDEALEVVAAADLRIERAVVDDVVAVQAARSRAQVRRAVDVADAERGEVGHQRGRRRRSEVAVQLQPVGRARDRAAPAPAPAAAAGLRPRRAPARAPRERGERARRPGQSLERQRRACAASSGCSSVVPGRLAWSPHAEHVLELHDHEPRRACARGRAAARSANAGVIAGTDRVRRRAGGQQLLALERQQQPRTVLRRARRPRRPGRSRTSETGPARRAARDRGPPTSPRASAGRAVARGDQRLRRIRRRRLETRRCRRARSSSTRYESTPAGGQRRAHLVGHRAEVLADHEAAVAVAFERDQSEQIVERVARRRHRRAAVPPGGTQNSRISPIT